MQKSTGDFFAKIVFPPLLAAILNFCVKCKNVFISETERDRVISTNVLTGKVSAQCSGFFPKNIFRHFWLHLEFLRKMQKRVYLGNGAR